MSDLADGTHWASHWTLDPSVHFLNHGSFGAVPSEVQEVQQDFRDRLEREPVDFILRQVPDLWEAARHGVAEFVHADPDGFVFVSNATDGVNAVVRSLPFESGDEIVYTNHGYNACNNVVDFVAQRSGARAVVAQIPFPLQSADEAWAGLEAVLTERTRLVLLDHITSPTGLVFPIEDWVPILQARGIRVLIDGAHSPGMVPLDLKALNADYFVANGHKWLCAPKSVGFLSVRADHRDEVWPAIISHGANTPRPGYTRLQDQFDWAGTIDPTPALCLPACIQMLGDMVPGGWPAIYERNHGLALHGRSLVCEALEIPEPAPAGMIGTLAAIPLPPAPPEHTPSAFAPDPLHTALFQDHRIEIPVFHYPGEPSRLIRLSAHLHNRRENYEALAQALVEVGSGPSDALVAPRMV